MGQGRNAAGIAFVDFLRQNRLRLAVGALILVCLLALGFSSLGIGGGDLASAVPTSAEQTSSPNEPDIGDAPAWTRRNAIQRDLLRRGAEQEAPKRQDPAPKCGKPLVFVDRSHAVPRHYAPGDLVSLQGHGIPTVGGRDLMLRRKPAAWPAAKPAPLS